MPNLEDQAITNPVKAIRAFCVECMGGSTNEVARCSARSCALYHFRLGKNPYRTARVMTEEQRAVAIERLAKAREAFSREDADAHGDMAE